MSFELTVSAKRDPLEALSLREGALPPTYAAIALDGNCDEAALKTVLETVAKLAQDGACSIIVEMQNVEANDTSGLQIFAAGLMVQRRAGVHVQVSVRDASLHERMARLPSSRDWLLAFTQTKVRGARRAIHVDGINNAV